MASLNRTQWIGGTLKSANRLRHIVAVFAKHGFQNIVEQLELGKFLFFEKVSASGLQEKYTTAERLRMAFEQLGPTFIKFGQLLASRPDIVPDDILKELRKLHDKVPALDIKKIKILLSQEYGRDVSEVFASFDEIPLAAASIAQVHRAKLKTGEDVVLKIQRPGIADIIKEDLQILFTIALLLEKYIPEFKALSLGDMVQEYATHLEQETNFVVEANNIQRFQQNFQDDPHVVIPKVYTKYCSSKILVLEELKGIPLSEKNAFDQENIEPKDVIHIGIRCFFKMIFIDGIFHADLHAGNIFVLPNLQIGLVDFGMVGYLSQKSRDSIAGIMMALATEDYEQLTYEFLELSPFTQNTDTDAFTHDLQALFAPYHGLSFANFAVGKLLLESTRISTRHGIRLPSDLMLLFKSILTIEGMGRELGEDIDLLAYSSEFASEVIKDKYNFQKIFKSAAIFGKDSTALISSLPRQTRQALKKFNAPDFKWKHEVDGLNPLRKTIESSSNILFLGIIIGSLVLSGTASLFLSNPSLVFGLPSVSATQFTIAGFLSLMAFYNYFKH